METTDVGHEVRSDTVEQELLAAERRYWRAMQENDVETALRLTDFPCVVTGPQGIGQIDEKAFAAMMQGPGYKLREFRFNDAQVRMLRDDVAVVAYTIHEELTIEGKPVTLDLVDSSTWIRRADGWRCASHTEAIAGDPFGRDRSPIQ
jgi:hypothetical protein